MSLPFTYQRSVPSPRILFRVPEHAPQLGREESSSILDQGFSGSPARVASPGCCSFTVKRTQNRGIVQDSVCTGSARSRVATTLVDLTVCATNVVADWFDRDLLSDEQQAALRAALAELHPAGDRWCGRTVATWMSAQLGRRVSRQAAWRALRHLGARFLKPRPRHVQADLVAQAAFKARLRPLLREVAAAFPHSTVELWAVDEHRIGLKPILHKAWCVDGQRPSAPVQHRYDIRHLVSHSYALASRRGKSWGRVEWQVQASRASELRHGRGASGHTTWTLVVGFVVETSGQRRCAVYPSLARLGAGQQPPVSRWRWSLAQGWGMQDIRATPPRTPTSVAGISVAPNASPMVEIAAVGELGVGCHWTGPHESLSCACGRRPLTATWDHILGHSLGDVD